MLSSASSPSSLISTGSSVTPAPTWAIPPWTKSAAGKNDPLSTTLPIPLTLPSFPAPGVARSLIVCPRCSKRPSVSPTSLSAWLRLPGWTTVSMPNGCPLTCPSHAILIHLSHTRMLPSLTPVRLPSKRLCSAARRWRSIMWAARDCSDSSGERSSRCVFSRCPTSSSGARLSAKNSRCISRWTKWPKNFLVCFTMKPTASVCLPTTRR